MVCDFSGEGSLILLLVDRLSECSSRIAVSTIELARIDQYRASVYRFSARAANGLYTVGGIHADAHHARLAEVGAGRDVGHVDRRHRHDRRRIANNMPGMVLTTAVLFPPFLVWVAWMGARWPAASVAERSRS